MKTQLRLILISLLLIISVIAKSQHVKTTLDTLEINYVPNSVGAPDTLYVGLTYVDGEVVLSFFKQFADLNKWYRECNLMCECRRIKFIYTN
jgi:hypothetical protein